MTRLWCWLRGCKWELTGYKDDHRFCVRCYRMQCITKGSFHDEWVDEVWDYS